MDNHSPWLDFERTSWPQLTEDKKFDVAIVGGGIAGVATLYFILKNTDKNVALVEKNKIASGATGHNAGFAINWLEKLTQDLIGEYGLEKTKEGYSQLDRGWELLQKIVNECGLPEIKFIEGGGEVFTSLNHFFRSCEEEKSNIEIGRGGWRYLVAEEFLDVEIPQNLKEFIEIVSQQEILSRFGISDRGYIAAAIPSGSVTKKARINSARFCFSALKFLEENFKDRFQIFENTQISEIDLVNGVLTSDSGNITSESIILCTNGYADFKIRKNGSEINKLKNTITRIIGYAVGFHNDTQLTQTSALFDDRGTYKTTPYFYYHNVVDSGNTLAVLGGPEKELLEDEKFDDKEKIDDSVTDVYKSFLENTFGQKYESFEYNWYGLMGYTKNGTRWIGRDTEYPNLFYNLGCNGVGIISSIVGAEKISRILNGEEFAPSMFDPE